MMRATTRPDEVGLSLAERHALFTYDAMIAASTLLAGCDPLLSEDMQHGMGASMPSDCEKAQQPRPNEAADLRWHGGAGIAARAGKRVTAADMAGQDFAGDGQAGRKNDAGRKRPHAGRDIP